LSQFEPSNNETENSSEAELNNPGFGYLDYETAWFYEIGFIPKTQEFVHKF